jgi:hypothetical protein
VTVLIVEDDERRVRWFREQYPDAMITNKTEDAMTWLAERSIDRLFLDHDLGTEPRVGRDVAKWLAANPDVLPGLKIVVHSVNIVSAPKILADLADGGRDAEWVPFTRMVQ